MEFFAPVADEEIEEIYPELATMAGATAPLRPSDRVYSVTWMLAAGETWTATVGERLTSSTLTSPDDEGNQLRQDRLSDTATVLAIFPGEPFRILTTAEPFTRKSSAWPNPVLVDQPTAVEYFE